MRTNKLIEPMDNIDVKGVIDALMIVRMGNYTEVHVEDNIVAFSYETPIAMIDSSKRTWVSDVVVSQATEQHKELFIKRNLSRDSISNTGRTVQ